MLYILYIRLQESHGYQTGQDADLQLEAPILKVIWSFDQVTRVKSPEKLKILYFHHHKTYG